MRRKGVTHVTHVMTFSRYVSISRHNCQGFLCWREYCAAIPLKSICRKDHLGRHKKQFHEGQNLKCPQYCQRTKLNRHMEKYKYSFDHENSTDNSENHQDHNELDEGNSKGKIVSPTCPKEFKWVTDRSRHMREVHSKKGRIKCQKCGQDFSR